jgi:Kelch motif
MKRTCLIGLTCLLLGIAYFHCTSPSSLSNNTGGSEVVGTLVLKTGGGPAKYAHVIANKVLLSFAGMDTGLKPVDSVVADSVGQYKFDGLAIGRYDFECKAYVNSDTFYGSIKDFNLTYFAPPNQPVFKDTVGTDTLYPPGSISGQVTVNYPVDLRHIYCNIPGMSYNANPDSTGIFKISNVPRGSYTVLFMYNGTDFSLADTQVKNIIVQSNSNTFIGIIKMYLSRVGDPPMPLGLTAVYDSLSGSVALSWGSVPVPDFRNFIILRENSNSPAGYFQIDSTRDTFFIDRINFSDTVGYSVYYKIQCFDSSGSPSQVTPAITINAKPPAGKTTVTISKIDSAGRLDFITETATYTNPSTPVKKLIWTKTNGDTIQVKDSVNKSSGTDFAKISWDTTGKQGVYFTTIDNLGRTSKDSTFVTIVQDKPRVTFLTKDTTVISGGLAQCSLAVSHRFGLCTLHVHLNGNLSTEIKHVSLGLDTTFTVGQSQGRDSVRIKITDSHGNSIDTGFVIIILPLQISNSWEELAPLTYHQLYHAAEVIKDTLYAIGGMTAKPRPQAVKTVEAYDNGNNKWIPKAPLSKERYNFMTGTFNNNIYAAGGFNSVGYVTTMEKYDGNAWTVVDSMYVGNTQLKRTESASCVAGNKFYIFGGLTGDIRDSVCNSIYLYDFSTGKWSEAKGSMQNQRCDFQAVQIAGKIYLVGGVMWGTEINYQTLQTIEIFDTNSQTCSPGPSMPIALSSFAAASIGTKLYIMGGLNSQSDSVNTLFSYDFGSIFSGWLPLAPLSKPRYGMSARAINGNIYMSGGMAETDYLNLSRTEDQVLMKYNP